MELSRYIEHTLLGAHRTPEQIERHCREAVEHRLFGICVAPVYVSLAEQCIRARGVRLVTVVAFPFGASVPAVKAEEARRAAGEGADEIDMVMAIGLALGGGWSAVEADIAAVRKAVPDATLKVIVETGYFERVELERAVEVIASAGADFVKTCTGYGPRGATVDDVELLFRLCRGQMEVKASGGIRTGRSARELIEAGATRIGTSRGADLAQEG